MLERLNLHRLRHGTSLLARPFHVPHGAPHIGATCVREVDRVARRSARMVLPRAALLMVVLVMIATLAPARVRGEGTSSTGSPAVTTETLGRLETPQAPGQALYLLRVTFDPGSSATAHIHPGSTVYHLEAGVLQFTLKAGKATIVRAAAGVLADASSAAAEPLTVGQEMTMVAGDTIFYDGSAVQLERNDGTKPAVVTISNLRGVDQPVRETRELKLPPPSRSQH